VAPQTPLVRQVAAQQKPPRHWLELQSPFALQAPPAPLGATHRPLAQTEPLAQSPLPAQLVLQALLPLQPKEPGQGPGAPGSQLPAPSQLLAGVRLLPVHEGEPPQRVPAPGYTQAPLIGLQAVAPQVACVRQVVPQQAPPRHWPELHAALEVQAAPVASKATQLPAGRLQ
jgi:hypothetical protein